MTAKGAKPRPPGAGLDLPDPLPDPAELPPLVINPDPRGWTLIESMEIRREFGYDSEQWEAALKDSPELALIGSAWLALRVDEPGITWKEAGQRITLGQLGKGGPDPKARTT